MSNLTLYTNLTHTRHINANNKITTFLNKNLQKKKTIITHNSKHSITNNLSIHVNNDNNCDVKEIKPDNWNANGIKSKKIYRNRM